MKWENAMHALSDYNFSFVSNSNKKKSRFADIANVLRIWRKRRSERRQLAKELPDMPDEALKDLGLTRREAHAASRRPFWRE